MIKAIETLYKGYRFRSRLEARWAVFFDTLGFAWEYEKEGYRIGAGTVYLPDFWLKDTQTWVEVKGDYKTFNLQTLTDAVDWGNGLPHTDDSNGTTRGLLLLGTIPEAKDNFCPTHPILQHYKGGIVNLAKFSTRKSVEIYKTHEADFDSSCEDYDDLEKILEKYWSTDYGYTEHCPIEIVEAYRIARQARFEHGETPVIR